MIADLPPRRQIVPPAHLCLVLLSLLTLCLLIIGGCGRSQSPAAQIRDANRSNIQRLTNLYTRHQMQQSGQGPKNEEAFKKYIAGVDQELLGSMGIDPTQIDKLFVSERDQQPFDIRYDVRSSFREAMVGLIFEREGVGGSRLVGMSTIAVKEIADPEQYQQLKSGKPLVEAAPGGRIPGVSR